VGLLDPWDPDYTLMMFIIKVLTSKMMTIIIASFELAKDSAASKRIPMQCEPT
jgi:hypothetical protein